MKAMAYTLKDNLAIKKNTNKYNYFKIKEIKDIIDAINNIKVLILASSLLLLVLGLTFELYFFAIGFGSIVICAYFGLNIYQQVMNRKIIF